ncbi:hypothetical protein FIBSPDRAFT_741276, partial [Athelia psychrophila]
GRLPAWPCRACGSANHWDRECPMWDRFQLKIKSVKWVEKEDPANDGHLYTQVYQAYLTQIDESMYGEREDQQSTPEMSAEKTVFMSVSSPDRVVEEPPPVDRRSSVEEVEDEDCLAQKCKPKAESSTDTNSKPPPAPPDCIKIPKRKKTAPGRAAIGTSVLSIRGRVNRMQEREIDLRLDSGADISLISHDFLSSLKVKPAIRQGMKMKLWQLTSKNESLAGYITLPLFVEAEDGTILESKFEAYVIPGMSVDILLGEDYQLCHEISVRRSVESGTRVEFGLLPHSVRAVPVTRTKDFEKMTKRVKFSEERNTIRAATDLKIAPNSVATLKVEGYFSEDSGKDWLVEKSLLANDDDLFFAVPNVLFSSSNPMVPVMNPMDKPRYVRKGEAIGTIVDPAEFLDTPSSE